MVHLLLGSKVTCTKPTSISRIYRIWARYFTDFRIYLRLLLSNREEKECRNKLLSDRSLISVISQKMQGVRKKLRLSTKGSKHSTIQSKACSMIRAPGVVYNEDILIPSGIANPALNCYCLQCLFNLSQFQSIAQELYRVHPSKCDATCCRMSNIFKTK